MGVYCLKKFKLYLQQLIFRQDANRNEHRSLQGVNEDASEICNTAENSRAKSILIYSGLLLGLAIACFFIIREVYQLYHKPLYPIATDHSDIRLTQTTSAASLAHLLNARYGIASERLLRTLIRCYGYDRQLKAGIYRIQWGESAMHLLKRIVAGDVLVCSFRIAEGSTQYQITQQLARAPYLDYRSSDWDQIAFQGSVLAEGMLLADTYQYPAGSQALKLLQQAHQNLVEQLNQSWQQRDPGVPYKSQQELLVVASILEKEAAFADERRLIAGVIINRLKKHMPLQMDPTVIYALGTTHKGNLKHRDLGIDSPYNTYRYFGLPPTPIAMVGKLSLNAAAHPIVSDYLYFVAKGDGRHQFSTTYKDQRHAVARYLRNVK